MALEEFFLEKIIYREREREREINIYMNKKNWLIIGVVVLVALGVWFYFDSREDVVLEGPVEDNECEIGCLKGYVKCVQNIIDFRNCKIGADSALVKCRGACEYHSDGELNCLSDCDSDLV